MPRVREEAMSGPAHIRRAAWRALLHHAADVARASRLEAIGWLLGFFVGDEPHVVDAVPATRYKHQSRYGAVADPREEADLAVQYPRNVGIVGIYHSHPFRNETRHAIFHSATDDETLKSRASLRENYLSVVTDGHSAECFVLRGGRPAEVSPSIEEDLPVAEHLRKYVASVSPAFSLSLARADAAGIVAALERAVSADLDRALRKASVSKGLVALAGLDSGATRNRLLIAPSDGRQGVRLSLRIEPAVFVAERDDESVLRAMRNEILDDALFLLWRGFDAAAVDLAGVSRFEANLGTLRVQETRPLPRKVYRPPERGTVLRRRA
ncbi:MAG: hypothetical protein A3K65_02890 [Euryarchaeota archaeon RBG_16_68_12]|nr:MAG: hypothetical protein A3K65_02890 [Euryarchaeota archaeon RBG_16_68_12]